ncbi:MAG: HEAT repeat domain-containing protein [Polyangiaceae bacterium]
MTGSRLRFVALALLATSSASAQVGGRVRRESARVPAVPLSANTLRTRLGIEVAESLLKDSDPEQRQRGFERLGSIGTAQSLDLLLKVFETGGAARSARDRLVAVRALSEHASVPAVRDFLVRVMVGVGSNPGRSEAIDGLIERAAALSLARAGDEASLAALGKALRQSGHVADTASDALLAFPPRNLEPIVRGLRTPTRAVARLLGALGDPRAIPALREIVRSAPKDVRPDAARSLAQLGVRETVELARHWLKHETDPDFRSAAARILLDFHESDAGAAVVYLLGDERTRASGLALANQASLPEASDALVRGARGARGAEQSAFYAALGRSGSREAFYFLGGALGTRETSSVAALALALSPTADAEAVLERALRDPKTRRAALRASLVRKVALDRVPSGYRDALRELSGAQDPADRALLAQANALFSPDSATQLVPHATLIELRALSRLALLPQVASALAARLAVESDPVAREALSACLVSPEAAELVPSAVLVELLDAGGLGAPLAARALSGRDSRTLRAKITSLLESDDPLLRSHAALGLGDSRDGSALGLLERAYRFETDETVRLAIVLGLGARSEPARFRTLRAARTLDAAPAVREAAVLGLTGATAARNASGRQSAWLELQLVGPEAPGDAHGTSASGALSRGALLITATGLAIPAFADPDGVLLVPALPSGSFELRLAAPTRTDDADRTKPP